MRILLPVLVLAAVACVVLLFATAGSVSEKGPLTTLASQMPRTRNAASASDASSPPVPPPAATEDPAEAPDPRVAAGTSGVEGLVVDDAGLPIAEATVTLRAVRQHGFRPGNDDAGSTVATGTTDVEGAFSLKAGDGPMRVVASASGYASAGLDLAGPCRGVVLRLPVAGRLCVLVLDDDDAPVEGARVLVWTARTRHDGRTGADGRATIEALAPGTVLVRVEADGRGLAEQRGVVVRRERQTDALLRLPPGSSVVGQVRDAESGDGLPGAQVWTVGAGAQAVRTDANGTYELLVAASRGGLTFVAVRADGHVSKVTPVHLRPGAGTKQVDVYLRPGSSWTGRVVDGAGRPVDGARVAWALPADAPPDLPATETDAAGAFTISPPPAAPPGLDVLLLVRSTVGDSTRACPPAVAPPRDLVVVVGVGSEVTGRVVDTEGKGAAFAAVRLAPLPGGGGAVPWCETLLTTTDEVGRWRLLAVPPGGYAVEVWRGFARTRDPGPHVVPSSASIDFGTTHLGPEREVEGTVTTVEGLPVDGAEVIVKDEAGVDLGPPVRTDARGGFTLPHVPSGTCVLFAERPDLRPARRELSANEGRGIVLTLEPGATLEGEITRDGMAYAGAFTVVVRRPGGPPGSETRRSLRDPRGRFRIGGLADGDAWIEVHAGRDLHGGPGGLTQLVADGTTYLQVELTPRAGPPAPEASPAEGVGPGRR